MSDERPTDPIVEQQQRFTDRDPLMEEAVRQKDYAPAATPIGDYYLQEQIRQEVFQALKNVQINGYTPTISGSSVAFNVPLDRRSASETFAEQNPVRTPSPTVVITPSNLNEVGTLPQEAPQFQVKFIPPTKPVVAVMPESPATEKPDDVDDDDTGDELTAGQLRNRARRMARKLKSFFRRAKHSGLFDHLTPGNIDTNAHMPPLKDDEKPVAVDPHAGVVHPPPPIAGAIPDTTHMYKAFVPVQLRRADGAKKILAYLDNTFSAVTESSVAGERTTTLPSTDKYYEPSTTGVTGDLVISDCGVPATELLRITMLDGLIKSISIYGAEHDFEDGDAELNVASCCDIL